MFPAFTYSQARKANLKIAYRFSRLTSAPREKVSFSALRPYAPFRCAGAPNNGTVVHTIFVLSVSQHIRITLPILAQYLCPVLPLEVVDGRISASEFGAFSKVEFGSGSNLEFLSQQRLLMGKIAVRNVLWGCLPGYSGLRQTAKSGFPLQPFGPSHISK